MRTRAANLFAAALLLCVAPLHAETPDTKAARRVVGSAYGKPITAADIKLTIPIDPAVHFNASDTERWELCGRIMLAFGKRIADRFVKEQKIVATADEIAAFKKHGRKINERQLRDAEFQSEIVNLALGSPNLSDEKRAELTKKHDMLQRLLPHFRDAANRDTPDDMARHFIVTWKTERELHRKYGGRVIFQQFGLEALDARRMLFEEAEKNGDLQFDDPGVRHMFYYYYSNMRHSVIDEKLLERPWFLGGEPE